MPAALRTRQDQRQSRFPAVNWQEMDDSRELLRRRRGLAAPLALPAGFAALLIVGAAAAATHGTVSAGWVLGLAAAIVLAGSAVAEPTVALVLGAIGWLTVIGFSRPPYAQLQLSGSRAAAAALI